MNTEDEWKAWWESEGRNAQRLPHHDVVDHLASMTRIAWLNGAFKAADEIERLRAERDEARQERDGYLEGNRQTLAALAEANEIAKRYKAERDAARRSVCEMTLELGTVFRRINGKTVEVTTPEYVADLMDWDCFKEAR